MSTLGCLIKYILNNCSKLVICPGGALYVSVYDHMGAQKAYYLDIAHIESPQGGTIFGVMLFCIGRVVCNA